MVGTMPSSTLEERNMPMHKVTVLLLAFVLALSVVPAMATQFKSQGTIAVVNYNSMESGRGVCLYMTPAGPGTGWFCLWQNIPLYQEMTDIVRDAYMNAKTCTMEWATTDRTGNNLINVVSCN